MSNQDKDLKIDTEVILKPEKLHTLAFILCPSLAPSLSMATIMKPNEKNIGLDRKAAAFIGSLPWTGSLIWWWILRRKCCERPCIFTIFPFIFLLRIGFSYLRQKDCFLKKLSECLIGGSLLSSVVLVSAIYQYGSAISVYMSRLPELPSHLPPHPTPPHPFMFSESAGLSSPRHTANSHGLSICFT